MRNELNRGLFILFIFYFGPAQGACKQRGERGGVLPSSVMMGMFDPVVTDACRTKPCTGLLSGEDLSIPGGVKPGEDNRKNTGIRTSFVLIKITTFAL